MIEKKDLVPGTKVRLHKPAPTGCCNNGCDTNRWDYGWRAELDPYDAQVVTIAEGIDSGEFFKGDEFVGDARLWWVYRGWAELAIHTGSSKIQSILNEPFYPTEKNFSASRSCTACGGFGAHRLMCRTQKVARAAA